MSRFCPHTLAALVALVLAAAPPARAQLTRIEGPGIASEAPVYLDADGRRHAALVKVKFSTAVVAAAPGTEALTLAHIRPAYPHVAQALLALESAYGPFSLVKRYPAVVWGDTLVVDPVTRQQVRVADLSQWVELHFGAPVPLAEVAASLKALPEVQYVDPPYVYHLNATPDDELFNAPWPFSGDEPGAQWNLQYVGAEAAWDLARGYVSEGVPAVIGLAETFAGADLDDDGEEAAVHPDLRHDPLLGGLRLDNTAVGNQYGDHGIWVAGHAGAINDNGALGTAGSVASLAWTVALRGFLREATGIREAVCRMPGQVDCVPVDVLNMSWAVYECSGVPGASTGDYDCGELREALDDALGTAAILTGSTGNEHCANHFCTEYCRPCQPIPGGYYSSAHDRSVITVNATASDYSLGGNYNFADPAANPVTQPTRAWMDLAAPGLNVLFLSTDAPGVHTYRAGSGTSFSAPTVASLVALLLSVNPDLTHEQVFEALIRTADEVGGTYATPGLYGELWSPYYGYGQIDAYRAVRYVIEHFGGRIGGATDPYPYRIAEPLTLQAGTALTVRAGTELFVDAEVLVEGGAALTLEPGAALRFAAGTRLLVEGVLAAEGALLTEAEAGEGWGGLVLRAPVSAGLSVLPLSTLTDTVIEKVGPGGGGTGSGPTWGAVQVYNRDLRIDDGSEIRSSTGAVTGLLVNGPAADVTVTDFSQIYENAGIGVSVGSGARVTVAGGSEVRGNGGGVTAVGFGATVNLDGASVQDNEGIGVSASFHGEVRFANDVASGGVVEVGNNNGGLNAGDGSLLDAGTCEPGPAPCPGRNVHQIVDNAVGGSFDAKSLFGAVLYAQGNFWNVPAASDLVLVQDTASVLLVEPLVPGGSPRGGPRPSGTGAVPRGAASAVRAHVDEAARAHRAGDPEAFARAAEAVVAALAASADEDDRRAASGAAVRLFARVQPARALGALSDLGEQAGAARPWAQRVLGVAYASSERLADARAVAASLVSAYPASEHARFGLGLTVRVAAAEADEAGAVSALGRLSSAYPEAAEVPMLAALVQGAFPEADVTGALAGGARASAAGRPAAEASTNALLEAGEARPNPASASAVLPFTLASEAQVEAVLYDVLGRRVSVLASGAFAAGRHTLALRGGGLPAGVYVVRLEARTVSGSSAAVAVRRLTLAR